MGCYEKRVRSSNGSSSTSNSPGSSGSSGSSVSSIPFGHLPALFLAPKVQQQQEQEQQQFQQQHLQQHSQESQHLQQHSQHSQHLQQHSQLSQHSQHSQHSQQRRLLGDFRKSRQQTHIDAVHLHFTRVLSSMRRNVDAANQSLPPQFKIQKMIDTRFINSAILETVTTSIFSVPGLAQNSNEMKKLLQVVVKMVMNVKTNTNTNTIQSWNPKLWLSNRLCDTLVELMVGELNVTNIHSMVYYIIDAIQSFRSDTRHQRKIDQFTLDVNQSID